jgi:curved DNA-binding protein CbpA
MDDSTINYFAELELPFGADAETVTLAYRKLSKIHHPDLNRGSEESAERMKRINAAYTVLGDTHKRAVYIRGYGKGALIDSDAAKQAREREAKQNAANVGRRAKARSVMEQYFSAIRDGDYDRAYSNISEYDKQYVTIQSFKEWRQSVRRLFTLREFTARHAEDIGSLKLRAGLSAAGMKFTVSITEQNRSTLETDRYPVTKHCIYENSEWRVLLGYRDLNEIARVFENLSEQHESDEMQKYWETYCADNNRQLNIPSRSGFLKAAVIEEYRAKRFKQPLVVARISLIHYRDNAETDTKVERIAATLRKSIRMVDVCGYLGNGEFAVLLVGLKNSKIQNVMNRFEATFTDNIIIDWSQWSENRSVETLIRAKIGNMKDK